MALTFFLTFYSQNMFLTFMTKWGLLSFSSFMGTHKVEEVILISLKYQQV